MYVCIQFQKWPYYLHTCELYYYKSSPNDNWKGLIPQGHTLITGSMLFSQCQVTLLIEVNVTFPQRGQDKWIERLVHVIVLALARCGGIR